MEKNIQESRLCFVGDIHGEFGELGFKISESDFEDTAFILLGDCGLGFGTPGWLEDIYNRKLKKRLEESGCHLYLFRGNHDDPEYYTKGDVLPGISLLQDYTRLTWGNREILVIGGGISVDRDWRVEEEIRSRGKKKLWWPDEGIRYSLDLVKDREDIIVSHMAPLYFGPVLTRDSDLPHDIWSSEKSDRDYLSAVYKKSNPKRWFFGHYHTSTSGSQGDCLWKGLGIMEIIELYE